MDMDIETNSRPNLNSDFWKQRIKPDEEIAKEDERRWAVVKPFFDARGVENDHLNSYNNFVKDIHEMFEVEPFEVEPEEAASKGKTVVVSFGEVEFSTKPEVEPTDRVIEPPEGHRPGFGSAGTQAADSHHTEGNGNLEGDGLEEDNNLNPPKISEQPRGIDDPPTNVGMENDPEADGPSKSEEGEDMDAKEVNNGETCNSTPNLRLLPVEARMRGITYSSPIYVKLIVQTISQVQDPKPSKIKSKVLPQSLLSTMRSTVTHTREERVLLGRIPVMVKSSLCHLYRSDSKNSSELPVKGDCCLDPGGYFIIKGSEKVIVAQEERKLQQLWVSYNQKIGAWTASCTTKRKGFTTQFKAYTTYVKLAVPPQKGALPLITVSLYGIKEVPIGVLFSALGVTGK
ncbi:unnamed protein product [Calypogeia fissa]